MPLGYKDDNVVDHGQQFETLYRENRQRVYNLTYNALRNAAEADDITQEAFARAWANFEAFDASRPFEAWVFRIATNLCIDHSRRRRRRGECSLDAAGMNGDESERAHRQFADSTHDPVERLLSMEVSEELEQAMGSLPALYRTVVHLVEQEHSYAEIGIIMGCPIGTIRSRVHRARVHLRRSLE